MKTVDVHNHFYPMSYLRELYRKPGVARLEGDPDGTGDCYLHYEGDYNVVVYGHRLLEHRLADMERAGMDVHVFSLTTPGCHVEETARGIELARLVNDDFAAGIRQHPGRFQAFAALPLQEPAAAARELERARQELGLAGATFFSNLNGVYPDDQRFYPVYEVADALGIPIFIHPTTPAYPSAFLDYRMVAVAGFLFDTTTAIARMVYSGLFNRFPKLRILLGHLGATVPYIVERMDRAFVAYDDCHKYIDRPPSEIIKEHCYLDTVNFDQDAIRLALAFAGRERLMLGSDYPHQVGDMPRAVKTIKTLFVDEGTRERILGANAAGMFGV